MVKIIFMAVLVSSLCLLQGCLTTQSSVGNSAYRSDGKEKRIDIVIITSYETLQAFVRWEEDLRKAGVPLSEEITKAADNIRQNSRSWLQLALLAKEAYVLHSTEENELKLRAAVSLIMAAVLEAQRYHYKGD